jgi:hypothetical protein
VGNNNRLAHRYWRKGLMILAGIWVFIFLAAAGEAIHTRISVPAHNRTLVDLLETKQSLAGASLQLNRVTAWALCLQAAKVTGPQLGPIDFLDGPALCSDPR